jgi:hypothetical protein
MGVSSTYSMYMKNTKKKSRWVYQLESIRPNLDLRTTDYVTLGMFDSAQSVRDRVVTLTKIKSHGSFTSWVLGRNDNEFVLRHENMYYRITRHILQA